MNAKNWAGGALPNKNSVVELPAWMSAFTDSECLTSGCTPSGRVGINPPNGAPAVLDVSVIVLPESGAPTTRLFGVHIFGAGILAIADQVTIRLHDSTPKTAVAATWADRPPTWQAFGCPLNWVVTGTKSNPSFRYPCHTDTAHFPAVCEYITCSRRTTYVSHRTSPFPSTCLRTRTLPAPLSAARATAPCWQTARSSRAQSTWCAPSHFNFISPSVCA